MKKFLPLIILVAVCIVGSCASIATKSQFNSLQSKKYVLSKFSYNFSSGEDTNKYDFKTRDFYVNTILKQYPVKEIIEEYKKKYNINIDSSEFDSYKEKCLENPSLLKEPGLFDLGFEFKSKNYDNIKQHLKINVSIKITDRIESRSNFGMKFTNSVTLQPDKLTVKNIFVMLPVLSYYNIGKRHINVFHLIKKNKEIVNNGIRIKMKHLFPILKKDIIVWIQNNSIYVPDEKK